MNHELPQSKDGITRGWRNILHQSTRQTVIEVIALLLPFWTLRVLYAHRSFWSFPTELECVIILVSFVGCYLLFAHFKCRFRLARAIAVRSLLACHFVVFGAAIVFLPFLIFIAVEPKLHRGAWWLTYTLSLVPITVIIAWHTASEKRHLMFHPAKALLLTLSSLLTLLAVELGSQIVAGPFPRGLPSVTVEDAGYWHYQPSTSVEFQGNKYHFNRWGFRGPEPEIPAEEDETITVLLVGDSMPFIGEDVFPAKAERRINEAGKLPYRVKIFNASMPGYSTYQIKRYYTKGLRGFDHDILILANYYNDFNREIRYKRDGYLFNLAWDSRSQALYYRCNTMRNLLNLVGFSEADFLDYRRQKFSDSWVRGLDLIEQLGREALHRGAEFAVFDVPQIDWGGTKHHEHDYYFTEYAYMLQQWCQDRDVPYCSALSLFLGKDVKKYRVSDTDSHYNEQGHELITTAFQAFVEEIITAKIAK